MEAPASIFFWGGGGEGGARKFVGGQKCKNARKANTDLPFYAEIVKFGLILTHLKLF